ncbi:hypothetical protein ACFFX0_26900 [Citricoccus parietis]|uniref:Uncharacterized protein n=1 Tax=Citricoccus parietis TaxID=592307 RepID=A0ABV5G6Q0_9MICC
MGGQEPGHVHGHDGHQQGDLPPGAEGRLQAGPPLVGVDQFDAALPDDLLQPPGPSQSRNVRGGGLGPLEAAVPQQLRENAGG